MTPYFAPPLPLRLFRLGLSGEGDGGTPTHLIRTLNNEDFNFDGLEGYVPQQGGRVGILRHTASGA